MPKPDNEYWILCYFFFIVVFNFIVLNQICAYSTDHTGPVQCVQFNPKYMMMATGCSNMVTILLFKLFNYQDLLNILYFHFFRLFGCLVLKIVLKQIFMTELFIFLVAFLLIDEFIISLIVFYTCLLPICLGYQVPFYVWIPQEITVNLIV